MERLLEFSLIVICSKVLDQFTLQNIYYGSRYAELNHLLPVLGVNYIFQPAAFVLQRLGQGHLFLHLLWEKTILIKVGSALGANILVST